MKTGGFILLAKDAVNLWGCWAPMHSPWPMLVVSAGRPESSHTEQPQYGYRPPVLSGTPRDRMPRGFPHTSGEDRRAAEDDSSDCWVEQREPFLKILRCFINGKPIFGRCVCHIFPHNSKINWQNNGITSSSPSSSVPAATTPPSDTNKVVHLSRASQVNSTVWSFVLQVENKGKNKVTHMVGLTRCFKRASHFGSHLQDR